MSEMVPYTGGGPLAAPSSTPAAVGPSSSPAPATLTLNQGPNWAAAVLLSLLALAAITIWRVHTGSLGQSGSKVKVIWAAVILGILISLASDLDKGLGAAFGGSVVLFMLIKNTSIGNAFSGLTAAAPTGLQGPVGVGAGVSSSSSSAAGSLPPGAIPIQKAIQVN